MKSEGEDSVAYMVRVKLANKDTDMKSLTESDVSILHFLRSCGDDLLKDKILSLDSPTMDNVDKLIDTHVSSTLSISMCGSKGGKSDSAASPAVIAAINPMPKQKYPCNRCGASNHYGDVDCFVLKRASPVQNAPRLDTLQGCVDQKKFQAQPIHTFKQELDDNDDNNDVNELPRVTPRLPILQNLSVLALLESVLA